jgi:hypothetical protein
MKKISPLAWILGNDTGVSAKTIWAVMMGETPEDIPFGYDVPHDPADFGRCYRLLNRFPEWKSRLNEVAEKFPKWGPMVREWGKMTQLYEKELSSGCSPKLYALIQKLREEGMIADGWVRTSQGAWEKKRA